MGIEFNDPREPETSPPSQTLYAFWAYDGFPYTLHGKIASFHETQHNLVRVFGYGGSSFRYKHIAPEPIAFKIIADLTDIKNRYQKALGEVNKAYHDELCGISSRYGLPMPEHVKAKGELPNV